MLKIRSYLPGKTSAVRHASTLFSYLSVMVVSRTKGYPAFTPVPLQIPQKSAIFFQSFFPWIESYSFVQRICFRDLEFLLQYKFEDGIVKFSQCSKRFFEILSFIIYIFNYIIQKSIYKEQRSITRSFERTGLISIQSRILCHVNSRGRVENKNALEFGRV